MFCTNNNLKEFKQIKTKLISKNKGKILDNCFVTIQPPSKRIPFLGVFVNDM